MSEDDPLYKRDPAAWREHLAEGNRTQPRKRVAADVVIRDAAGRLLLVDPVYKPDWDLPGGMVEANETPLDAARREVAEELGVRMPVGRLLVVDWVAPHGPLDDLLMFLFDGGVLDPTGERRLWVQGSELREARFWSPEKAAGLLRSYVWRRVEQALVALRTGATGYLHDGHPMR